MKKAGGRGIAEWEDHYHGEKAVNRVGWEVHLPAQGSTLLVHALIHDPKPIRRGHFNRREE